ncbi:MAG: NAD(P)H-hydrate dehydratase, partial [Thermoplasmata archaeon]
VYLIKGREHVRSKIANKNLERLECPVVEDIDWNRVDDHIIVDGVLGTGVSGSVREPYRSAIQNINGSGNEVVSIDVPSGLGADIQVEPELTVTFHDTKYGMNEDNCGEIIVKDIGIPNEAELYTGPGELILFPVPHEDSHKGGNGTLLIVGGGPFTGAPALSAFGAYRAGVDLVHLAVPSKVNDVVSSYSPSFIVHEMKGDILKREHVDKIIDISAMCDTVLIGPGLGSDRETLEAVEQLLNSLKKPLVIDADALRAFKNNKFGFKHGCVITPHHGELKNIKEDCSDLSKCADELAEEMNLTVLLKGKTDYITDGERHKWNDFGNAGMTVGGTGDTLAGVVGSLLAKGMEPFDAARVGAYITCRAGEIAFEERKWGILPTDVSEAVPAVLKEM